MNSPFGNLYTAILNRIKAEVPDIRYIDQDLGQLAGYSKRPGVAFPAVLIDFQNWTYKNLGKLGQVAEGNVLIYLAFDLHTDSSSLAPEAWRARPLKYYEHEHDLGVALHGWSPGEVYGHMMRTGVSGVNLPMGVRGRPLVFRLDFEDWSASPSYTSVAKPPPDISSSIVDKELP